MNNGMTLDELIAALRLIARREKQDEARTVHFDFCGAFPLLSFGSSRCFYERPAINWAVNRRLNEAVGQPPPLDAFLAFVETIPGATVHGYKGGEYTVSGRSLVHIDGHGECTSTVIADVEDEVWRVILATAYIRD